MQFMCCMSGAYLEYENVKENSVDNDNKEKCNDGFLTILDQIPQIGQTKISELAKSFLWESFIPVHIDDTLFHVLLLFSNHRLQVVPVIERSSSQVTGFVTQSAALHLLLQSSGLEWFGKIADKALSEFRFENEEHVSNVLGNQSLLDTLHVLWKNRIGTVAVVDQGTRSLLVV
ncbi:SNF1-related protein kinase regulatory subunit gamma-1 like [Quillaja saponaria]|uniref:SNF1-related protein kinase regulatory subunit gamma-1 like n=1 Tax=Quillaja saponaria TaxID=32244 RepID=A0AAD7PUI1_QUISA|nr:SNF1-related protein kinase regulatory subunit gamma-1 like [Quillaja saponaria]